MMELLPVSEGSQVLYQGAVWEIRTWVTSRSVSALNLTTNKEAVLQVTDLKPVPRQVEPFQEQRRVVSDRRWQIAESRRLIIEAIFAEATTREDVEKKAEEANISAATAYRWKAKLDQYGGQLQALVPLPRGPIIREPDTESELLTFLNQTIEALFLSEKGLTQESTVRKVQEALRKSKFGKVSRSSLITRIQSISPLLKAKRRGKRRDVERHSNMSGTDASHKKPMDEWQIDHTPLSVMTVHEEKGKAIRRVWLTLVIDVGSRMVVGWHLSLDPPCSLSVALALAHAVFPKESYLERQGVDADYPVWSKPRIVHADNAGEFRGDAILFGCRRHNLILQWRPVKKPHYGAHIERLIGSVETMIAEIDGALKRSPKERGDYDSAKEAIHTIASLEKAFAIWVVKLYAHRPHKGIENRTPMGLWLETFFRGEDCMAGPPPRPMNYDRMVRDFLPIFMRMVHPYGIEIEGVKYYCDELAAFIGVKNTWSQDSHKYIVKRHDHWISPVYFLDPRTDEYIEVPFADRSRPRISRWELEEAKVYAQEKADGDLNEDRIFAAHEELEAHHAQAKETTAQLRKDQRKREWKKARELDDAKKPKPDAVPKETAAPKLESPPKVESPPPPDDDELDIDFGDIEFSKAAT